MNKQTFEKLNEPRNVIRWPTRVQSVWANAELKYLIDIYRKQEEFGGFSRQNYRGLRKLRNFGGKSIIETEERLREFGLPELVDSFRVVRDFDAFAAGTILVATADPVENILTAVLKTLGRKYDPQTVEKVMSLTQT